MPATDPAESKPLVERVADRLATADAEWNKDTGDYDTLSRHFIEHLAKTAVREVNSILQSKLLALVPHTPPAQDVQIDTRPWVMAGETILDDPDEYRLDTFVRHDDLPEIITAYLAANNLVPHTQTDEALRVENERLRFELGVMYEKDLKTEAALAQARRELEDQRERKNEWKAISAQDRVITSQQQTEIAGLREELQRARRDLETTRAERDRLRDEVIQGDVAYSLRKTRSDRQGAEIERLRAALAEARSGSSVQLPDDWRRTAEKYYDDDGHDAVMLIDGWIRDQSRSAGEAQQPWTPQAGELVTAKARGDLDPDPIGKYIDTNRGTARIDTLDQQRKLHGPTLTASVAYVDADTLRPIGDAQQPQPVRDLAEFRTGDPMSEEEWRSFHDAVTSCRGEAQQPPEEDVTVEGYGVFVSTPERPWPGRPEFGGDAQQTSEETL